MVYTMFSLLGSDAHLCTIWTYNGLFFRVQHYEELYFLYYFLKKSLIGTLFIDRMFLTNFLCLDPVVNQLSQKSRKIVVDY
jgi:hypothetical protein